MKINSYLRLLAAVALSAAVVLASESHGTVTLGGLPIPGATVTATQGDKKVTTLTDGMGAYYFPDLADGTWNIQVDMSGFGQLKQDVTVAKDAPPTKFELTMKPLAEMQAQVQAAELSEVRPPSSNGGAAQPRPTPQAPAKPKPQPQANAQAAAAAPAQAAPTEAEESNQRAADGLLVNGSQLNGGTTPFALNPAFGNNRRGLRSLYTFNLSILENNSVLNARPYSQSGLVTPKAPYNNMTIGGAVGGPLRIPHLVRNLANFTVTYQFNKTRNASSPSYLLPTQLSSGDVNLLTPTAQATAPMTPALMANGCAGQTFTGVIPAKCISQQARALLSLYPAPNASNPAYNYQVSLISPSYFNAMQARLNRQLGRKNSVYGTFGLQDISSKSYTAFHFIDPTHTLGLNIDPTWRHQFTPRMSATLEFQYTRQSIQNSSYFQNGQHSISGDPIANQIFSGTDHDPFYYGPPSLGFSSGILGLGDANPSTTKNQTGLLKTDENWNHGRHSVTFGADMRRQQFNYLNETNPRGTFSFTGAATGNDLADFLLGIPDSAAVAYGNSDKYLRSTGYDAYVRDDWRLNSAISVVLGVRYEYNGPISELYGRLVNLNVAPGFSSIAPMCGTNVATCQMNSNYPSSLVRSERYPFEPEVAIAWRPISGSSLIVRSGYSLRFTPSLYLPLAMNMYQQYPLSTSLQPCNAFPAANNCTPLTLENAFASATGNTQDNFGVDPNFRESNVNAWYASIQKDLPGGMQMQARYDGIKGTRLPQFFLPNTYPIGGTNPCPTCPIGFRYETSNGNETRSAGTLQLRRRLHNGFTAQFQYVYAKAIDDTNSIGQPAQNWLNLAADRGLSSFDQRQAVTFSAQYTSGMGLHGGAFLSGWRAAALKEWTLILPVNWGTGTPETPTYQGLFPGTTYQGLRPNYVGGSLSTTSPGVFVNQNVFAQPLPGQFGNAGIGIITGPSVFSMGGSAQRTFRVSDRVSMTLRVDANNVLNNVVFASYNTSLSYVNGRQTNEQFGLPSSQSVRGMRTMQTTFRFTF